MKIRFAIIISLALLAASCRSVKEGGLPTPMAEEDRVIKEWEEYVGLIGEEDPISISTIVRLTEGYIEAMGVKYRKEMEEYEKRQDLYNKGMFKTAPIEPVQDYSLVINHLRPLFKRHLYGEDGDAIRYLYGYILYEQGNGGEAAAIFEDLIRNYLDSRYLLDVSFRLGEFYFETGRMGDAVNAYSRILSNPKSVFYDKALYKLGWAYYKLDEFKKAADLFISLVDLRWERDPGVGGLAEEGISSIVMCLSQIDTKEAIEYLRSKGNKDYAPLVYLRLGDRLSEDTKYDEAMLAYSYLVETFPEDQETPFVFDRMADIFDRTGAEDAGLEKRWEMAREFNPAAPWYRKNYPPGSERVDNLTSKTLAAVSKRYHYKGKKEADMKHLERSIEGYRMFLSLFPSTPNLAEVNLLLAEALFDTKRYPDAAREYENAAKGYKEGPERGEVAYSAFLSYEVMFYQSSEKRDEALRSAQEVLDRYRSDISKSGRLEKALYSISDMYARAGAIDKARESLVSLDAIPAYKRIAELSLMQNNLEGAENAYRKLTERSREPAFRESLAQIRYRIAEEHLKAGRVKEAAIRFSQSFIAYPGFKVGEVALIKLGYIYLQGMEMETLEEVVRDIVREYPGSNGAVSLLLEAGQKVEKEEPLKAAGLYEYASTITANGDDSLRLVFAAAVIYHENGSYGQAEALFHRYLQNKWLPLEDEAEASYRLGDIQLRAGRGKEGIRTLEGVMELKGKIDNRIMAKTRLLLTGEKQRVYAGTRLTQPFEKTFKKKTQLLSTLLEDYSDVARYGVPDLLPAVYFQIGVILEDFRDSILEAERPKGLSEEEIKEYNFLLEERAYPYEEQAINAYEKSVEAGRKQTLEDEWTKKSLERLVFLRPALYKKSIDRDTKE